MEREQILGDEARSRVPEQFVVQDSRIANPPTLLLALQKLAAKVSTNVEVLLSGEQEVISGKPEILPIFKDLLIKTKRWISYIEKSQRSKLPLSYRWFGRTKQHCLASGMDDFPRHRILSESESNVDVLTWLLFSYQAIAVMEVMQGETQLALDKRKEIESLKKRLDEHWDEESNCFGDIGVIGYNEDGSEILGFEHHIGYVSILPFALMLLDANDPRIESILDAIEDPEKVITLISIDS